MGASSTRGLLRGTTGMLAGAAVGVVLCVGLGAHVNTPQVWTLLLSVAVGSTLMMRWLLGSLLAPLAELRLLAERARETGSGLAIEPKRYALFSDLAELMQRVVRPRASLGPPPRKAPALDEEQSAFLRSVSHELRTPLNAILGFTDVLLNELDGPITGEQRENLSIIRDSGQKLSLLVIDMIDVAALSSGESMRPRSTVDVGELLEVVREAAIERRGMRPVHVRVDVAQGAERIVTERETLVRALRIVTEHVLEVTQSGEVALLWGREGDECVLRVHGDGLAGATRELAALVDDAEPGAAKPKAARLRLAIARELFALLGARVQLANEPEHGVAIVVRLPVGDAR